MAELSVTKAYTAGFRLIQRQPLAPAVWGLLAFAVYFVLELSMWGTISAVNGPVLTAQATGQPLVAPLAPGMIGQIMSLLLAFGVVLIVLFSVQYGTALRAVLKPGDKGFFYLRFGKAELLLIAVALTQAVCSIPVMFGLEFAVIIPATMVSVLTRSPLATGLVAAILAIPAIGAFLWLWTRFSMAGPMSFAEGRFYLFKSWDLTKGASLKLLGLAALMFVTMIGLELVFLLPFYLLGGERAMAAMYSNPDVTSNLPLLLAMGIPGGIIGGYIYACFLTPWADAYNQLRGPQSLEEVF